MAQSRRFSGRANIRLAGRGWEDAAPELERLLRKLLEAWSDSIPPGFNDVDPTTIVPGDSADSGAELQGWAAADHTHEVNTGTPAGLANTTAEGTSDSIPRLDHTHKRDIRVKHNGTDVATRNALNFVSDPSGVSITVVDDAGNDEIDVSLTVSDELLSEGGSWARHFMFMK